METEISSGSIPSDWMTSGRADWQLLILSVMHWYIYSVTDVVSAVCIRCKQSVTKY